MEAHVESVEWSRRRWQEAGQPDPDRFAAMAAILRTHQVVGAALDKALRGHDLGRTAYLMMTTLRMSPGYTRPLGQLSRQIMVHPTTITLVIDQLEKRDLVRRSPHPTDRRTILAILTPEGLRVLDETSEALAGVGYGLDGVSEQLAVTLTEILRQVREKLGDV
jgi:DNA-binding MarR family transcriptional regulator